MAEKRALQIICSIEPSLYSLAAETAKDEGDSLSSYVRGLIIEDQVRRKNLDAEQMALIITGKALSRVESYLAAEAEPVNASA